MTSGKKDHLQVFNIIDLVKTKVMDPTIFAVTFLPRRIWPRAFGPARFFFAAFSCRRAASSRASRIIYGVPCDVLQRRRAAWSTSPKNDGANPCDTERWCGEGSLSRQSTRRRTIYGTKSPPCAGVARDWCLPSGPRPCIYANFSLSIAKLPKLQNINTKLLDTSFR